MIEKEYKLPVSDISLLASRLRLLGADEGPRNHELTVMYDNESQLMERIDGRIRLRTITSPSGEEKITLSFKKPLVREGIKQEIEHETVVNDKKAMQSILEAMGFNEVSSYERFRTNFTYNVALIGQTSGLVEIDIDEFPFGNFVEVEGEDISLMKAVLLQLELDPENHIGQSYDGLYQSIEREKGNIPNTHIRFEIK